MKEGNLEELIEEFGRNKISSEIKKLVDNLIQGKKSLTNESVQKLKAFSSPFFGIKLINISGPISQYQEFISRIEDAQPELYQEEKEDTQNRIFKIERHPIEYVKYLFPLYNDTFFYNNLLLKCTGIIEECFNIEGSEIDSEKLPEIKSLFDSIKKRDFRGALTTLKSLNNHYTLSKEKQAKVNRRINELIQVIEERTLRRKHIFEDPAEFIRKILSAVNDTQSHIDLFCAYIHRLVHIKNEGNSDFEGKYYQSGSKYFDVGKFLKMCKEELNDFTDLHKFIKRCASRIRKMRNLQAHRGVKKLSFSKDYKKIVIPRTDMPDYRFSYDELCDFIISYGNFINKIGVHPKSRYDPSEDTFGVVIFGREEH